MREVRLIVIATPRGHFGLSFAGAQASDRPLKPEYTNHRLGRKADLRPEPGPEAAFAQPDGISKAQDPSIPAFHPGQRVLHRAVPLSIHRSEASKEGRLQPRETAARRRNAHDVRPESGRLRSTPDILQIDVLVSERVQGETQERARRAGLKDYARDLALVGHIQTKRRRMHPLHDHARKRTSGRTS